jgi:hypothetical protein
MACAGHLRGSHCRQFFFPMRKFFGSAWFVLLTALLLGGLTAGAYALLRPTGADVGNSELVNAMTIAGWVLGPAVALLSLILMFVLNGIRRLMRVRKILSLDLAVLLVGVLPWLAFSYQIAALEPRNTKFAVAVIEFAGEPLVTGSFVTTVFVLIMFVLALFLRPKRSM